MGAQGGSEDRGGTREPLLLQRLLPAGKPATVAEIIAELGLWERAAAAAERPRVMLNMVSSADGSATVGGRSGPLSSRADRELFHGLRLPVDAVLAGAGTVRAERYGRIIPQQQRRALRLQRGRSEEPLACIVSRSLALDADIPLLSEPAARVVVLTAAERQLSAGVAQIDYVRAARDGALDLSAALQELYRRFDVRTLLCEGGPHLASQLLAAGLVDELVLSLSPTLAGGEDHSGQVLPILAGPELDPPLQLELLGALHSDSQLFLRYGVARQR